MMKWSDEVYKKCCVVLTPESEKHIEQATQLLVKQGEDPFVLNKSAVIRKALKKFVQTLKEIKDE